MIEKLKDIDNLKEGKIKDTKLYIHNDHRFILSLLYNSQKNKLIPKPCKMIIYDYHDDLGSVNKDAIFSIKELLKVSEFDENRLFEIIKDELDPRDCDWIKAGMELGIIGDAVIFGVHELSDEYKNQYDNFINYKDHLENNHTIFIQKGMPNEMFGMHGELGDIAIKDDASSVRACNLLDWNIESNPAGFIDNCEKIVLNFDLDVFTMHHDGYVIPWVEDIWVDQILKTSSYSTTKGISAASFTEKLGDKSGLIVIAREPEWCTGINHKEHGSKNADQILRDLNKNVFNDKISYNQE